MKFHSISNKRKHSRSSMLRVLALVLILTLCPAPAAASSLSDGTPVSAVEGTGTSDSGTEAADQGTASGSESAGSDTETSSTGNGNTDSGTSDSGNSSSESDHGSSGSEGTASSESGSSESESSGTSSSGTDESGTDPSGQESETDSVEEENEPDTVDTVRLGKISAGSTATALKITWEAVDNADGYNIYRKTGTGSYSLIYSVTDPYTTSWEDTTGLDEGTSYTYTVRAWVKNGLETILGDYDLTGITGMTGVIAPLLRKSVPYSGTVFLLWNTNNHSGGYEISRRTTDGTWKILTNLTNYTQNVWKDSTAVPGESYYYRMRAWTLNGTRKIYSTYSALSGYVTCRPSDALILSVTPNKKKTYDKIIWHKVADATGYAIYKKNSTTKGKWVLLKKVKASSKATLNYSAKRDKKASGSTYYQVKSYVKKNGKLIYSEGSDSLSNASKKLSGKKILFIGDSITYGYNASGRTYLPYPDRVAAITGAKITNKALNGSTLSVCSSSTRLSRVQAVENGSITFYKFNIICIALGTNDYTFNNPIGSISDTTDTTFYGAWNIIFSKIRQQNPTAKVILITPPYRGRNGTDYSCAGMNSKNYIGLTQENYVTATVNIAKKYGALVYRAENNGIITAANYYYRLFDAIHPTDEAYALYGTDIANFILKHY